MESDNDPTDMLLGQHVFLGDLFAQHQEALVDRRWADAARLLGEYEQELLRHMELEERSLLPLCEAVDDARWPAAVYRAEHRRIEQLLRRAAGSLTRARQLGITPRILISLLEEERTLKHLLEHHHEREEKALFVEVRGGAGSGLLDRHQGESGSERGCCVQP